MSNIDDHTLNACLARVIGKDVVWNDYDKDDEYWQLWDEETGLLGNVWNPLQNASQMEEVEAWLIEKYKRLALTMHWGGSNWHVTIRVYGEKECEGLDPDKKRALALAIYQMEQSQNGR